MAGLAATLGSGAMTNSMEEVLKAKVIFLIGSNTTWNHPVFGALIKQAVKHHGAKLIVCDPRRIDLVDFADIWLQQRNGSDVALLSGLQHIILREGWEAADYIRERTEGFEEYRKALEFYTPEKVEELTGVAVADLEAAARLYATSGVGALYYCMGITQHSHGVDNVKACVNLALITGNIGVEGGGVNPLRGQNNVQGACDMGGLPNVFTGYQPVTNPTAVEKFSTYWNAPLSDKVGMTLTQMIPECGEKIRAIYILGENPMVSDPNLHHVEESLRKLDFLVVQDIFLTETARLADVVLPGVTFAEKLGTFSNTERRVQLSSPAIVPTGNVRQDYEIIADLAARFGQEFPRTPEGLFREIRDLTPSYAGLTYDRIRDVGISWPCPNEDHPGTRFLHAGKFARGLALLTPIAYRPPAEEPDVEFDLVLEHRPDLRALPHRQHDPPVEHPRRRGQDRPRRAAPRGGAQARRSPRVTGWPWRPGGAASRPPPWSPSGWLPARSSCRSISPKRRPTPSPTTPSTPSRRSPSSRSARPGWNASPVVTAEPGW